MNRTGRINLDYLSSAVHYKGKKTFITPERQQYNTHTPRSWLKCENQSTPYGRGGVPCTYIVGFTSFCQNLWGLQKPLEAA